MSVTGFNRRRRVVEEENIKLKQEVKQLKDYKVVELKEMCKEMNLEGFDNLKKDELIKLIEDRKIVNE